MIQELQKVQTFMTIFGQTINDVPTSPKEGGIDLLVLRKKLQFEENQELCDGLTTNDLVAVLDGICDLLYVTYGCAITYGLQQILPLCFNEVHRSNMSKLWSYEDLRDRPVGSEVEEALGTGKFIVSLGGKVIKPKSYSPANLRYILEEAMGQMHLFGHLPTQALIRIDLDLLDTDEMLVSDHDYFTTFENDEADEDEEEVEPVLAEEEDDSEY